MIPRRRWRYRNLLVVLIALCAVTPAAEAQFCGKPPKFVPDGMPVMGLRAGTPVIFSMYIGPTYFSQSADCNTYVQPVVEPGVGGGQLGLAYGKWKHHKGFRVQAVMLRTWGPTWQAPSGETFAGMEMQMTNVFGIRVGYFRRLGTGDGARRLVSLGVAYGI